MAKLGARVDEKRVDKIEQLLAVEAVKRQEIERELAKRAAPPAVTVNVGDAPPGKLKPKKLITVIRDVVGKLIGASVTEAPQEN